MEKHQRQMHSDEWDVGISRSSMLAPALELVFAAARLDLDPRDFVPVH